MHFVLIWFSLHHSDSLLSEEQLDLLLKALHDLPYFPTKVRKTLSDFAVLISIVLMTLLDYKMGLETPKLTVPDEITPTRPDRSWSIAFFHHNPWWQFLLAAPFAMCAGSSILFIDRIVLAERSPRPKVTYDSCIYGSPNNSGYCKSAREQAEEGLRLPLRIAARQKRFDQWWTLF